MQALGDRSGFARTGSRRKQNRIKERSGWGAMTGQRRDRCGSQVIRKYL